MAAFRVETNGVIHLANCAKFTFGAMCNCAPTDGKAQETRRLALLHAMLGREGESLGVWQHRPETDGEWTSPEGTFWMFKVEDVHRVIDDWAKRVHLIDYTLAEDTRG